MTDWKRKLAAYLHDPPGKCSDIRRREEQADAASRQTGIAGEAEVGEYVCHANNAGVALDRLWFPPRD